MAIDTEDDFDYSDEWREREQAEADEREREYAERLVEE